MNITAKSTLLAVLAVAALGAASTRAAAAEPRDSEQFDRTIPFHDGGRLKLNNFSGHVTITGAPGSNIVIHAVRHATRDRLEHTQIGIEVDSSLVSIEANKRE